MRIVETRGTATQHDEDLQYTLAGEILSEGSEMLALGFNATQIQTILGERIHHTSERRLRIAHAVRGLAKYPPAFGLVGTVLGLVSLMRALTENSSSSETGVRMAVALVATLYGLIVSNLVLNPAGEAILKQAMNEKHDAELMLQALLLAADGSSLLEAHEMLNSFVQKKHRRSFAQSEETPNAGAA
jgi:chemotaxis protein MotA